MQHFPARIEKRREEKRGQHMHAWGIGSTASLFWSARMYSLIVKRWRIQLIT
jgi:hypothetical protein